MTLFEEQALRHPERVAVQSAAGSLTYADLDRRSRHMAGALRALGVDRDVVVQGQ
ncbi:MAG: AMP-binding protein [Actinobacteria bacterium]|nr:AMP-binding protein [Actinomycetota bacterium]